MSRNVVTMYPIVVEQIASSGAWAFNTLKISQGVLTHILITPLSAGTTFDISITDEYGIKVFDTITEVNQPPEYGTPTGRLDRRLHIPLRGIYTIACTGASADEAFTGRLMVEQ